MLTVEQVFENYGDNENKLAVFAVSRSTGLASLYSTAAQKYGTPNPPKAPYIVNEGGGGEVITASGGNSYKPFVKVITPAGEVTDIDWYAAPSGYGYEKIKDILKNDFGIDPGGTSIQDLHTQQHAERPIVIQKLTSQYCRLFSEQSGQLQLKVYSLKGQRVFQRNVMSSKGVIIVLWNTTLAPGSYLLVIEKGDRKLPHKIFISKE